MTFKEAIVKMIEGKKMVNDKFPSITYWFDLGAGGFYMKGESFVLASSAVFEKIEREAYWKEKDSVDAYVDGHDFVIKNFDSMMDDDKQELFCILKKYKDTTTDGR